MSISSNLAWESTRVSRDVILNSCTDLHCKSTVGAGDAFLERLVGVVRKLW